MSEGGTQRLRRLLLGAVPVLLTVALLLLLSLPLPLPYVSTAPPLVALIAVYYWAIYRPDLMPPGAACLLGLFVDVLGGGPLGLNALVLVCVQWISVHQRAALADKSFYVVWLAFGLIAPGAATLAWLVACVMLMAPLSPLPGLVQAAVSVALYPLVTGLFRALSAPSLRRA